MNKEEIIKYCLTLENTYKDSPFPDDFESVTMKHLKNKKWFALIMIYFFEEQKRTLITLALIRTF